jgi:predicted aspartyl protease
MLQDLDRTGELWYSQVHDEMVRIVPAETAKDAMLAVVDFLEEPVTGVYGLEGLQIPFDSKTGPNWLDLEELTR